MSNILNAIVAVRRECGAIAKDATNPHFKSTYATLNAILEAVEPVLEKHGVMLMQTVKGRELHTSLHTIDGKESTEQSIYPLVDSTDPQKFASSLTYGRRYSIVTMLGLMTEDDDGNKAASLPVKPAQTVQTAPYKPLIGTNKATPVQPKKLPIIALTNAAEINRKRDIAAIQATDFATFEAGGVDAAQSEEYVCQFGKWKGSTIAAIIEEHGIEQLDNYIQFITNKATTENKPIKGSVKEFIDAAQIVLADRSSFDPSTFGNFDEQGNQDGAL